MGSADSAKNFFFQKLNLASGFGKNTKWEDMMQELNLVVGPEVGPLLKFTKNGKTVQNPGLIHEKEMLQDIVKNPEVVHEVNRRKENHPTKSIKNGITKRRKPKSDGIILPLRHHRAVTTTTTRGPPQILPWN